jgi:ATP-dependent Clp protease ATP-binding subunit ClpC
VLLLDDLDQLLKNRGELEKFTLKAARVMFFAGYEARQLGSRCIDTEHILLAILREDKALTNRFIHRHASVQLIRKQIGGDTTNREKVSATVNLPISESCERILAYAAGEAEQLGFKQIGTEHLLLGILREDKSLAAEMLKGCGVQFATVREEVGRIARTME